MLGPDDEKVGTLVIDLEYLFQMYRKLMHERLAAQAQTYQPGSEVPDDKVISVSDHLEGVEDADGQLHLRPKEPRPTDEETE